MRSSGVLMTLALSGLLAGCISPTVPPSIQGDTPPMGSQPRPVVAIVDSGINPYHDVFRDADPTLSLRVNSLTDTLGRPPVRIALSSEGSYEARVAKDGDLWSNIEPGRIYWFEGTRVLGLGISLEEGGPHHILDEHGHGTGVAGVVAQSSANSLILAVETAVEAPGDTNQSHATSSPAFHAVASLPWVDVVSLSFGAPFSLETPGAIEVAKSTRRVAEEGKMVVSAAGNQPTHPVASPFMGPPWVISVTGGKNDTKGRSILSAQAMDVVSNYAPPFARHDSTSDFGSGAGTSNAAPTVGSVLAEALHALRQRGLSPDPGQLRNALNATASYWAAGDWEPEPLTGDPLRRVINGSLPVVQPWVQMGWGWIGPEHVDAIVAHVAGEAQPPSKPSEAVAYMEAQYAARRAYWEARTR